MEEKRLKTIEGNRISNFAWEEIWRKNKPSVIFGLAGLVLVSAGILTFLVSQQKETELEILPVEETESGLTLFVDLEGAVEKPGVYELPADSRLNDLLTRAGGLSAEADREWVEKNLNLAQELVDGAKIYIPKQIEAGSLSGGGQESGSSGQIAGVTTKININMATASELDSLWGIGEKRAADIIASRPYSSIEELLERKIIPKNVYERIKDQIAVF